MRNLKRTTQTRGYDDGNRNGYRHLTPWRLSALFLAVIPALSILPTPARADVAMGRILGIVEDQSGAVVPRAAVGIKNLDSGFAQTAVTNQQGRYAVDALPVGRYEVSATFNGFEASVRSDVAVVEGRESTVDFVLNLRTITTSVVVTESAETLGADTIVPARARTSDTATLLGGISGLDVYSGGGVSSLPVIHGMADDRVNVLINGMPLASACSNHMNPPMSHIDPANVGGITLMAGITPVSQGGDSTGGTIVVDSAVPEFAQPGQRLLTHGGISDYHRTNGVVNGGSAWISAATGNFRIGYIGSYVHASDYKDGAGAMIKSTLYESQNNAAQLAFQRGIHSITLDLGYQYIPQQAFVNARMDMTRNQSEFANLRYQGVFGSMKVAARVSYENARHEMNLLADKQPGMNMPMDTKGANLGYSIGVEIPLSRRDSLRMGNELHRFTLDDWWPPMMAMAGAMGPDALWNVRNGRRDRFGTYIEWQTRRGKGWTELLGIRSDVVLMNTDNVAGYNMVSTMTGSAAYYADATEFNARDHRRTDANFDATAMARYEPSSTSAFEFGYARKTRSPNLYERYLWIKRSAMAVDMNGWFGDGNGYTGDLDLRPEVANTVSATANWHSAVKKRWEMKVTPYYTRVQDYIDADRCLVITDGSNGCTAANLAATTGFVTLMFANHAARLYGVDGSGRLPLGDSAKLGSFTLTGVLGYVRGKNLDTGENLYNMMPLHGRLSLEQQRGNWSSALEFQAVDAKTDVDAVRVELPTPGYALVNLRAGYQWHFVERVSLRLDAGVDNLTGRNYVLPLGGRYWIGDKKGLSQVPAIGRCFYTGLTFQF